MWLFWALYLSENPEKNQAAQLFSVLMLVRNVSWAPSVYIIMISKALCETEDWTNDAENSALPSQE